MYMNVTVYTQCFCAFKRLRTNHGRLNKSPKDVEHLIKCGAILKRLVTPRNACEMWNRLSIVTYCNYSFKYDEMVAKINS